jgi:NAD(P)-dependent dehydrogenase (short-subunit alcohol dehydrogenase family)
MVRAIYDTPEKLAKRLERIPLGRMADPSDISAAVAFLASNRAAYITGVTIGVDGGGAVQ